MLEYKMSKKFSFALIIMSLLMVSVQVSAQRTVRVDERVQRTYVNHPRVDVAQWLRLYPGDAYHTEINNIAITGTSFATNTGNIEVYAQGRLLSRMAFRRIPSQVTVHFPLGTRVSEVSIRVNGEVHIERVIAYIVERRWQPAPRPIPPRYPGPAPRPTPPRHEPAPRPRPPRHTPAPQPRPPRYEPAPMPGPPRDLPGPTPLPRPPRR